MENHQRLATMSHHLETHVRSDRAALSLKVSPRDE